MAATVRNLVTVYCFSFILIQIGEVQPQLLETVLGTVSNITDGLLSNPATRDLCHLETVI